MEESREEKKMKETSWTMRFMVTGCSCFLFSAALKFLDGTHSRFLLLLGMTTLGLATISLLLTKLINRLPAKKTSTSS
jgi:hypothetical protein